jgi:hypothetical protein
MASAPSLPAPTWTTPRWRADRPGARARWLLRFALAAPLLALAVWADRHGFRSPGHLLYAERAGQVAAGGPALAGLRYAYPPVPTLLASVLPGGPLALCAVAALFAATASQAIWERLAGRRVPVPLRVLLLLTLVAVPAVAYASSEAVAVVAALSLFVVALEGFTRFTAGGETDGGFTAGLALGLAFGFDPVALVYAVALGVAALVFGRARFRADPAAGPATVLVLAFPALFGAAAWTFLEWRFTGTAFGTVADNPDVLAFRHGVLTGAAAAVRDTAGFVLHVPLYLVLGVLFASRRPAAAVGYAVPLLGLAVTVWVGLRYSAVTAYSLLTLIALMTIRRRTSRPVRLVLAVVAAGQLVLAWRWPPASPAFDQWLDAVLR